METRGDGDRSGAFSELLNPPLTRRRVLRYGGGALLGLALPGVLAACGDDNGGATTTAAASGEAPTASGTIDYFGWEGEDLAAVPQMQAFLKANGAQVKASFMPTLDDITPKLQGNDSVDLLGYTPAVTERLQTADLLQPLDTAKLPNLEGLLPRWQEDDPPGWFFEDGERLFVPSFFQAFSLVYNSDEVTDPPSEYRGLLEPEFKDRIVTWAEPNAAISIVADMLGIPQGQVPKDRLDEVADLFQQFIDQSKSVAASPGDIVTQLASGEVIAAFLATPQFTLFANGAGGKGAAARDVIDVQGGNMSFVDGYSIPSGADNPDSAYAFIDQILDPKVNAAISEGFAGGVVVEGAEEFLPADRRLYPADNIDAILEDAPLGVLAPLESDEYVTQGEWIERFTQLTS